MTHKASNKTWTAVLKVTGEEVVKVRAPTKAEALKKIYKEDFIVMDNEVMEIQVSDIGR